MATHGPAAGSVRLRRRRQRHPAPAGDWAVSLRQLLRRHGWAAERIARVRLLHAPRCLLARGSCVMSVKCEGLRNATRRPSCCVSKTFVLVCSFLLLLQTMPSPPVCESCSAGTCWWLRWDLMLAPSGLSGCCLERSNNYPKSYHRLFVVFCQTFRFFCCQQRIN